MLLALDVGTSSVRALTGRFDGKKLRIEESGRFYHGPVYTPASVEWDMLGIYQRLEEMIRAAVARYGAFSGMAVDSWGTDAVVLDRTGALATNGLSTRDQRFKGLKEEFFRRVPESEIYERTGIQFLDWNTLYLAYALMRDRPWLAEAMDRLLFAPDCFAYLLTGEKVCDRTIASTSQMLNARTRSWDARLLAATGLPAERMLEPQGIACLGAARVSGIPVYMGCGHDTAAAVAGIPLREEKEFYIVAGSWAMMGVERDLPVISDTARILGFSNEGSIDGRVRFLKNSMGMWLIQESRREWARQGKELSFADIAAASACSKPYRSIIDVNDPRLQAAGDVPGMIGRICLESGQPVPETVGEVARCISDSLAFKFRLLKEQIELCIARPCAVIHVAAGGSQDATLCQTIADVTGCCVYAGPAEASAFGNCATQLIAQGEFSDLSQAREMLRASLPETVYEPQSNKRLEQIYLDAKTRIGLTVA